MVNKDPKEKTISGDDEIIEETPTVKFTYKKSSLFRVIKADGAWGDLTPRGDIIMSLFTERTAYPDVDEFEITDEGGLKLVKQTRTSEGLIREFDVAVSMRPETAFSIAHWLLAKVKIFEQRANIKMEKTEHGVVVRDLDEDGDTENA